MLLGGFCNLKSEICILLRMLLSPLVSGEAGNLKSEICSALARAALARLEI